MHIDDSDDDNDAGPLPPPRQRTPAAAAAAGPRAPPRPPPTAGAGCFLVVDNNERTRNNARLEIEDTLIAALVGVGVARDLKSISFTHKLETVRFQPLEAIKMVFGGSFLQRYLLDIKFNVVPLRHGHGGGEDGQECDPGDVGLPVAGWRRRRRRRGG
jgi:hypothetical protein